MSSEYLIYVTYPKVYAAVLALVNREFMLALNPELRPRNWDWAKFDTYCIEKVEETAENSVNTTDWEKHRDDIMEAATRSAGVYARGMLKSSGILNWWPNPAQRELP